VDKQAAFIEYYEQLKDNLSENEPFLFMDAVHPTQATKMRTVILWGQILMYPHE
jgi:hypothetical protein